MPAPRLTKEEASGQQAQSTGSTCFMGNQTLDWQVQEAEAAWRVEGSARAGFKVFRRKEHTDEGSRFAVQSG